METTVKQRLIEYLKYKKIGQNKFESMAGLSNGYIHNLRYSPSPQVLQKIFNSAEDLNRTWLLTGEGEMLAQPLAQPAEPKGIPYFDDAKFGCSPAGFMGAIESSKADDHVVVPGLRNDGQTFIVRARGNSMVNKDDPEQSIPDGAYVAIQKSNLSTPQWGEVYALSTDDGCIIKRLYPSERENYVKCVSLNDKEYPCFELHSNEIHDIAIVKAVLTVSIRK